MEIASTLVNVFFVLVMGGLLNYMMQDRFARLQRELGELKGGVARLEARMDSGFTALRSGLTVVALAVRGEAAGPRGKQDSLD
jgi:hypothetical protein